MSAAEKLKALDKQIMHRYLRDSGGPLASLSLVLPELIAVVEAAELALPYKDWDRGGNPFEYQPPLDDLRAALAALDAKLAELETR